MDTFFVKDENGRRIGVKCFWAHPENYAHIAGKEQRQIIITFTGDEIEDYNRLIELVGVDGAEATIKDLIEKHIK